MNDWITRLKDRNSRAVLLEPRELLDNCIVGLTRTPRNEPSVIDQWDRSTHIGLHPPAVPVYDADLCVAALISALDGNHAEAEEWFARISSVWLGPSTPCFRYVKDAIQVAIQVA